MSDTSRKWPLIALIIIAALVVLAILQMMSLFSLKTAREKPEAPPVFANIELKAVEFSDLPGWNEDTLSEALPPFILSCEALWGRNSDAMMNTQEKLGDLAPPTISGTVTDWQGPCAVALKKQENGPVSDQTALKFFQDFFTPFLVHQQSTDADENAVMNITGTFTGYFEPIYEAASEQTEEFSVPVLPKPENLIDIDLGAFREEYKGVRLAGKLEGNRLIPYDDHAAIIENGIDAEPLAWMEPTDLLFLQIQGSGKLQIDEDIRRIGYASQNGHPYTAIGRELIQMGAIPREKMSMQAIRGWLDEAPEEEAARVRQVNASYVFFRDLENLPDPELGPLGAQGVQLTAGRSLAVDRRYHAMGAPIYVNLETGLEEGDKPYRRLMIAQDTGGAIRGAVRGDVYTGSGAAAGELAGKLNAKGSFYVLLPKALGARLLAEFSQEQR